MPKSIRIFFFSFLLAPLLAFFIKDGFLLVPYYLFGSIGIILFIILLFQKKIIVPKYIYPLFLFAIYFSVWDFFNGRFEEFGPLKLLFKNYPLHIISILLIIENVRFDDKFIKKILFGFKILLVASLIFTLIQLFISPTFYTSDDVSLNDLSTVSYQIRNTSIWGYLSPLDVGLSLLPILAILLGFHFHKRKLLPAFFYLIMGAIVAVFTNSRWTIVNLVIIVLPILFVLKRKRFKTIIITILSIFILGFTINNIFNTLGFDFTTYLEGRLFSKSSESRFLAIELFKKFFPLNPIFGTGVRVDLDLSRELAGRSSQIHIGYLSSLYEFGLVGSVLLFLFWYKLFKTLYKNAKIHKQKFLMFGFVCFLLANFTLVEYSIFHVGLLFIVIFDRFYLSISKNKFEYSSHFKT